MIVLHKPASDHDRQAAKIHFEQIVEILGKPGGFVKLTTAQRKFLLGTVLASVVPVDKRIRNVELDRLQVVLEGSMNVSGPICMESLALAEGTVDLNTNLPLLAKALNDLLGIEDRCNIVSHLWDLALCDNELHSFEEQLVYQVADLAGVPRKRVIELMARAAGRV